MKVRLAREEEVKSIIRFDHIARSSKYRREFIKRSALNKRCYVAAIKGKPVGYTVLE